MTEHPRPWHRNSVFGEGPRRKLNRELRAQWQARLILWHRSRDRNLRLTGDHVLIAQTLLRMLGQDGRLDPSHQTLSDYAGRGAGCVKEALKRLRHCGLVLWVNRIVRSGRKVRQTSNAYMLTLGEPPKIGAVRCEATSRTPTPTQDLEPVFVPAAPAVAAEARAAMARRCAVAEARLLNRGSVQSLRGSKLSG